MTSDRARSLSLFDVCNVTVHVVRTKKKKKKKKKPAVLDPKVERLYKPYQH